MHISRVLKRKRDLEKQLTSRDPAKNIIYSETSTGDQTFDDPLERVISINTLTGIVSLIAGANIVLTPSGQSITIDASGGSGGSGSFDYGLITDLTNTSQDWGTLM